MDPLYSCLRPYWEYPIGAEWRVTLCAVDGAKVEDVIWQLSHLPHDTTHLVLSIGGNNALSHIDILENPVNSEAEVLSIMAEAADILYEQTGIELKME